jgi:farnesyl diphosphate synthase
MTETFDTRRAAAAKATDAALDRLLTATPRAGEIARPPRLLEAMRYATLSPGKRLRPFLLIEGARLFDARGPAVVECAAALECVHAYSLVHDDLPAMDDDDFRRGRPTVHRAFDQATAILAGDALLTFAFDIVASLDADGATRAALGGLLARAAGMGGMAGGQHLDLATEGARPDEAAIRRLQAMKTGALFRFACEGGAALGGASPPDQARLRQFGEALGLAFQIADDLIDATATPEVAGKATAKDAGRGKATLVALHGIDAARTLLGRTVDTAVELLAPYGARADVLREAARFVANRQA